MADSSDGETRRRLDGPDVEEPDSAERRGAVWHLDNAAELAHAGTEVPASARLRSLKKAMAAGASPFLNFQVEFNRHIVAGARDLIHDIDHRSAALRAELATELGAVDALEAAVSEQRTELERLAATTATLAARLEEALDTIAELRAGQDALLQAARDASGRTAPDAEPSPTARQELEARLGARRSTLYRNLERTFRGSRDEVREMLAAYLPDVERIGGPVVDVGCGRGEWLELLREAGVESYGVDLNDTFVDDNRKRGLDVRLEDAISHLNGLPPATVGVITGFHLAEHLPFDTLVDLLDASHRALRRGGLLILETPNPQNLVVGSANFWIDPTHLKPLHPLFLEFLALERGFARTELRWLHPHPMADLPFLEGLPDTSANRQVRDELASRLFGARDYALLATRGGGAGSEAGEPDEGMPTDG